MQKKKKEKGAAEICVDQCGECCYFDNIKSSSSQTQNVFSFI